ncbi:polynucleotide kinase-phosphatase [Gordonia sinesedis]
MSTLELPELALVVLVGVTGSGKSTFAHKHFRDTEILSSDALRGIVADDPTDQGATADAFAVLTDIAERRLARGLLTVVDATSLRPEDRRSLLDITRERDVFAVAIVLDVPADVLYRRAAERPDIDDAVVKRQLNLMRQDGKALRKEGFRFVHTLTGVDDIDATDIVRTRLFNDRTDDTGPFDIIGDVHGCATELVALLGELGWRPRMSVDGDLVGLHDHPDGRRAIFVGDLVDRGPDTPAVLDLAMSMVSAGQAFCVRGNHEEKLLRVLRGQSGRGRTAQQPDLTHGVAESVRQLDDRPAGFRARAIDFLAGLVSHYVFDGGKLVVAHAGLAERYHGRTSGRVRTLAMYGETTGDTDRWGFPVRADWARDYRGEAAVVYGHTPVPEAAWRNNTLCVDTGCVFGGRLTALRYPERETVSVPAAREYWLAGRPLGYGDSVADDRLRSGLALADVTGKRSVTTGLGPPVTVRAENAAAALEVMSRWAIDPRWIRYLPPTMSPAGAHSPDLLEDPAAAFSVYADSGVSRVVCEEKHMGSRAVLVVCRDSAAARASFGIDGRGALYTRTGRAFFDDATTDRLLTRASAAVATTFDDLGCDWLIVDAELLPWNIKADALIRESFAAVTAAAEPELAALAAELDQAAARGIDVSELRSPTARQAHDVAAYTDAYARHVMVGAGIDDVRIAPFEILAHGGGAAPAATLADRPHSWHLAVADTWAAADPALFRPTRSIVVDLDSASSRQSAARWWTDLTAAGAEGTVVKPMANLARDRKNRLVLPGVKVRGPDYLRIVYGPSYRDDLARLRSRDLRHKRSQAMREYQLGRAALDRHVRGAPLWQVHEPVFALLALESEPVDPRL